MRLSLDDDEPKPSNQLVPSIDVPCSLSVIIVRINILDVRSPTETVLGGNSLGESADEWMYNHRNSDLLLHRSYVASVP
jgi:hypothetical protein